MDPLFLRAGSILKTRKLPPLPTTLSARVCALPRRADAAGGGDPSPASDNALLGELYRGCRGNLWWAIFWYIFQLVCTLTTPVAVFGLLDWLERDPLTSDFYPGPLLVLGLSVATLSAGFGAQRSAWLAHVAGMQTRSALCTRVFRRALTMSTDDGRGSSIGEVSTLIGSDSGALLNGWYGLLGVVLQPVEIIGLLCILFYVAQWAAVGAIAVTVFSLAISVCIGDALEKQYKAKAEVAERRVQLLTEIFSSIKVVKLNCWEEELGRRVEALRSQERARAKRVGFLSSLLIITTEKSVDMMAATVMTMYGVWLGKTLTAPVAFSSWIVLGVLHAKVLSWPGRTKDARDAKAALQRFEAFLRRTESGAKGGRQLEGRLQIMERTEDGDEEAGQARVTVGEEHGGNRTHSAARDDDGDDHGDDEVAVTVSGLAVDWSATAVDGVGEEGSGEGGEGGGEGGGLPDNANRDRGGGTGTYQSPMQRMGIGRKGNSPPNGGKGGETTGERPPPSSSITPVGDAGDENKTDDSSGGGVGGGLFRGVDLKVRDGELVGVTGSVGSGKTTLLHALLGELPQRICVEGRVTWRASSNSSSSSSSSSNADRKIAYVPQKPFITSATLRENVLFGSPFVPDLYATVIASCGLTHDIALMEAGDATRIGDRGVNLSGGQRQRVAVARAAYRAAREVHDDDDDNERAGVYKRRAPLSLVVMDDSLSACDAAVASLIFDRCLNTLLRHHPRVLVTHSSRFLPLCDTVAELKEGELSVCSGSQYLELIQELTKSSLAAAEQGERKEAAESRRGGEIDQHDAKCSTPEAVAPAVPADASDISGASNEDAPATPVALQQDAMVAVVDTAVMVDVEIDATLSARDTTVVAIQADGANTDGGRSSDGKQQRGGCCRCGSGRTCWLIQHIVTGIGGRCYGTACFLLLVSDILVIEASVALLSLWVEDPLETNFKAWHYGVAYYVCVVVYWGTGFIRHQLFVCGSDAALGRLHASTVQSLLGAEYTFFASNEATPGAGGGGDVSKGKEQKEDDEDDVDTTSSSSSSSSTSAVNSMGTILDLFTNKTQTIENDVLVSTEMLGLGLGFASFAVVSCTGFVPWLAIPFVIGISVIVALFWSTNTAVQSVSLIEARRRVPLLDHVQESLAGLTTVRAFGETPTFATRFEARLDAHTQSVFSTQAVQSWFALRCNLLGGFFYTSVAACLLGRTQSPGVAGFLLVNACFAVTMIFNIVENKAALEVVGDARDLMRKYASLPQEQLVTNDHADGGGDGNVDKERGEGGEGGTGATGDATHSRAVVCPWDRGEGNGGAFTVELDNVSMRYERNIASSAIIAGTASATTTVPSIATPLVLRGVSFTLAAGESVGVVGRTGAGKSSLINVITRLVPSCGGRILFNGVNTDGFPLHTVRGAVTVISQESILFHGSLRLNLDPFSKHNDADLERVLRMVDPEGRHFIEKQGKGRGQAKEEGEGEGKGTGGSVVGVPGGRAGFSAGGVRREGQRGLDGLDGQIDEGGSNLSTGQVQLLCIARAMLRRPRLVLVDEATAALDEETDDVVQAALHRVFGGGEGGKTTMLHIAHRLRSIAQCDRVLVMDQGRLVEEGPPATLLRNPASRFAKMAEAQGGLGM